MASFLLFNPLFDCILLAVCIRTIKAHSDPVLCLHYDPEGELLVSCSFDSLIRIWDSASGACLKTIIENDNPIV